MTRVTERNNAAVLVEWLNVRHGMAFQIPEAPEPENSDIDVRATDHATGKTLCFQNVQYRTGSVYPHQKKQVHWEPHNPGFKVALGKDLPRNEKLKALAALIDSKFLTYPPAQRREIVLLVELGLPTITRDELRHFRGRSNYGFQAIYFVQSPVAASNNPLRPAEGFVYPYIPLPYPTVADADAQMSRIADKVMGPTFRAHIQKMLAEGRRNP